MSPKVDQCKPLELGVNTFGVKATEHGGNGMSVMSGMNDNQDGMNALGVNAGEHGGNSMSGMSGSQ